MSDISKINPNNGMIVYDLKDSICRTALTVSDPTEGDGIITFGVDANGNYGYKKVGADTVTPFKSGEGGVSEFGSNTQIQLKDNMNMTYDESPSYRSYSSNKNILLYTSIELDAGLYLVCIPTYTEFTDLNLNLETNTDLLISPISETNIRILYYTYLHVSLYKIDSTVTINKLYNYKYAFKPSGSGLYSYITFIKLQ